MTSKRTALFALLTASIATVVTLALILAGDVYLHHKYSDLVGLNVWGYRGPAVGHKQSDEWRLAVLGESTAFGYGVHWRDSFPAQLERVLNQPATRGRRASVVNLAYNADGAYSYKFTLRDYEYLNADALLFYSGYNDLREPNLHVFRSSAIFRLTGYLPIFPTIFAEKAMAIRWNGRLEDAYQGRKTTFKPNITERATASALEAAVAISQSLDAQLSAPDSPSDGGSQAIGGACGERWKHYCSEMYTAVKTALDRRQTVLMVTQPYINDRHREQQERLTAFLRHQFPGRRELHFANLGEAVDLTDTTLCYDGMHLNAAGNGRIAAALAPHVLALMPERGEGGS